MLTIALNFLNIAWVVFVAGTVVLWWCWEMPRVVAVDNDNTHHSVISSCLNIKHTWKISTS